MPTFAVVKDSIVINNIIADTLEVAENITGELCVEYTEDNPAHIGLGYDGVEFEQPPVAEAVPYVGEPTAVPDSHA